MDRVAGVDGPAWCCPSMADGQPASRRCPGRSAERRSEPRPNCRSRIRGAQRPRAGFTRAAQSVRYLTTNQGHPGSGADCDNTSGGAQEILASGCADPWLMTRRSLRTHSQEVALHTACAFLVTRTPTNAPPTCTKKCSRTTAALPGDRRDRARARVAPGSDDVMRPPGVEHE